MYSHVLTCTHMYSHVLRSNLHLKSVGGGRVKAIYWPRITEGFHLISGKTMFLSADPYLFDSVSIVVGPCYCGTRVWVLCIMWRITQTLRLGWLVFAESSCHQSNPGENGRTLTLTLPGDGESPLLSVPSSREESRARGKLASGFGWESNQTSSTYNLLSLSSITILPGFCLLISSPGNVRIAIKAIWEKVENVYRLARLVLCFLKPRFLLPKLWVAIRYWFQDSEISVGYQYSACSKISPIVKSAFDIHILSPWLSPALSSRNNHFQIILFMLLMPDKGTTDLWTQLKFDIRGENNNQNKTQNFFQL